MSCLGTARIGIAAAAMLTMGHGSFAAVEARTGAEMQGAHVASWGSVEVAATPELAFAVLTDYDRMAQFLPGMVSSQLVARTGTSAVEEQTADVGALFFSQRVLARLAVEEKPPSSVTLRALSGSFKELTGTYVLTRLRDRTRIDYWSRFMPDFKLPPLIGLYAVKHSLENHLESIAAEILRRAGPRRASATIPGPKAGPKAGIPPGE